VYGDIEPTTAIVNGVLSYGSDKLFIQYGNGITSIELPALTSIGWGFAVIARAGLTSVILTALRSIGAAFIVYNNAQLTYLSAPALTFIGSSISVCGNSVGFADPWPVMKPSTGYVNQARCDFKTGNAACTYDEICP
jgi:hypothetical protein